MLDPTMTQKLDHIDKRILVAMQKNAGLSQRALAEEVGLSQNACWRRLQRLNEAGVIAGQTVMLDRTQLGLDLVVFVMMRTRHHSANWLAEFRRAMLNVPEVVDLFRIGGDYDYLAKVVTEDMQSYDRVYQRIIAAVELDSVTSYFSMESIAENRPLSIL